MRLNITSALLFFLFLVGNANAQRYGHLTIFSEDGDKFFLVLNGERINSEAQTNLRVEGLPQPYYNAKIIFENKSLKEITTNNLGLTDVDDQYMDVTYKIRRDKKTPGKMKMSFFSMTEIQPDFAPPASVFVMHYGEPASVQTVTTTTTTTGMGGGVNAGISMPGINMNVSIQDPTLSGTMTQTTTTTTTSSASVSGYEERSAPIKGCRQGRPMPERQLSDVLNSLRKQNFEDTRLKSARQIVSANCLSAAQIAQMCREFKFEDNRLDLAKFAYAYCVDPSNYYKVNDVFTFSTNVDELNDFTSGR